MITRGDDIRRMLQTDEGLADYMMEHNICDGMYSGSQKKGDKTK